MWLLRVCFAVIFNIQRTPEKVFKTHRREHAIQCYSAYHCTCTYQFCEIGHLWHIFSGGHLECYVWQQEHKGHLQTTGCVGVDDRESGEHKTTYEHLTHTKVNDGLKVKFLWNIYSPDDFFIWYIVLMQKNGHLLSKLNQTLWAFDMWICNFYSSNTKVYPPW